MLSVVSSCSPPVTTRQTAPDDPATRLQAIPAANSEKYRGMVDRRDWKNPYLIVREDGVGLLDLANHEIHILKPEDVIAALANLPPSAWPYGRVVAAQESGVVSGSEEGKIRMRKNRALLAGTLESLKVAINWVPAA